MDWVTIDFEASCLPRHGRSFPIEVGISGSEGTRAWLIRPAGAWRSWDWTEEALSLHGIRPEQLERSGTAPKRVFGELCRAIGGRRLIADSSVDSYWWETLANAAGDIAPSPIEPVSSILDELGASSADIFAARAHADRVSRARHRAGDDARWLWTLLARLRPADEGSMLSSARRRSADPASLRTLAA